MRTKVTRNQLTSPYKRIVFQNNAVVQTENHDSLDIYPKIITGVKNLSIFKTYYQHFDTSPTMTKTSSRKCLNSEKIQFEKAFLKTLDGWNKSKGGSFSKTVPTTLVSSTAGSPVKLKKKQQQISRKKSAATINSKSVIGNFFLKLDKQGGKIVELIRSKAKMKRKSNKKQPISAPPGQQKTMTCSYYEPDEIYNFTGVRQISSRITAKQEPLQPFPTRPQTADVRSPNRQPAQQSYFSYIIRNRTYRKLIKLNIAKMVMNNNTTSGGNNATSTSPYRGDNDASIGSLINIFAPTNEQIANCSKLRASYNLTKNY